VAVCATRLIEVSSARRRRGDDDEIAFSTRAVCESLATGVPLS